MFCPKCGEKVKEEADFCLSCGKKIEKTSQETHPLKLHQRFSRRIILSSILCLVLVILVSAGFWLLKKEKPKSFDKSLPSQTLTGNVVLERKVSLEKTGTDKYQPTLKLGLKKPKGQKLTEALEIKEKIPKEFAQSTDELFSSLPPTKILEKAPLIVWGFEENESGEAINVTYEIPEKELVKMLPGYSTEQTKNVTNKWILGQDEILEIILKSQPTSYQKGFDICLQTVQWYSLQVSSPTISETAKNIQTYDGQEKQITSSTKVPTGVTDLDIDGENIVWVEYTDDFPNTNLYLYNLSNDQKTLVNSTPKQKTDVHVSGNKIVWEEVTDTLEGLIYLYNIETKETKLLSQKDCPCANPVLDGDLAAWVQSGYSSILVSNLATGKQKTIQIGSVFIPTYPQISYNGHLAISGSKLVWVSPGQESESDLNERIWLYDFETDEKKQITKGDTPDPDYLSISGDKIAMAVEINRNMDIYLYDLSRNEEKQITINDKMQRNPSISGNLIVWEDFRNNPSSSDIYLYDLDTNQEKAIITHSALQLAPKISGKKIIWLDNRSEANQNVRGDIYALSL